MNEQGILTAFNRHFDEFVNLVNQEKKPLLAHYTSLESLEKICEKDEILFSNPLFMNDLQELKFGMIEGKNAFDEEIQEEKFVAKFGAERVRLISELFGGYYHEFETDHALNLYVFFLSEHDADNNDGLLSMWRGYGGNGGGAALIFNTDFVAEHQDSPFLIGKVRYASNSDRQKWIRDKIRNTKDLLLQNTIADSLLYQVAF